MTGTAAQLHFVGVGGSGLSALARVALLRGMSVSGSDRCENATVAQLAALGLRFQVGHAPDLVRAARLVIASSAVPADNPELVWARDHGVPVWKRHQFVPWLAEGRQLVAVSGTHGKTTTTALTSVAAVAGGLDPTCVVGGIVNQWGANARVGQGTGFVWEADEYDRTFLAVKPAIGVITSVELDHPDCYPTIESAVEAFSEFARSCGTVVGCADDERVAGILAVVAGSVATVSYGHEGRDWRLLGWRGESEGSAFRFADPGGREHDAWVPLWGLHSVRNALAAIATASLMGAALDATLAAVGEFGGTDRRFTATEVGEGITVVDEYAHHPSAVRANIVAARQRFPDRRLVVAFQPHTFSRVTALYDEFVDSLRQADALYVFPVFGAREQGDAEAVAAAMAAAAGGETLPRPALAAAVLLPRLRPGDVVLNLGAGDGPALTAGLAEAMRQRQAEGARG
ncbi:MAG: UDP-N-acetylmuramate--L-alanine ligase [Anaerolineae bacterium]